MGTTGKKWTRKDRKWTEEIMEFVKSVCPLREHGFNSRRELAEEINRRFGREFSIVAIQMYLVEKNTGDTDLLVLFKLRKAI